MLNSDEASPSVISAGQALLVKMLITLGPHGIFCSDFVMLITLKPHDIFRSNFKFYCILALSNRWYVKRKRASPSIILARSISFNENAHNS